MAPPSLPLHLVDILTRNRKSRRALELREDLWKHFEFYLVERGYKIAWDGDSKASPNLPLAANPFVPKRGEAFSAATAGREGIRWGGPRSNPFLMGAYDRYGRLVVAKIISSSGSEISILRKLAASAARNDPYNHTIPVLEYISAGDWTLVIMPSWELSLRDCVPVSKPAECLAVAVQSLQGLAYMHRLRVVHLDVYPSNILCNHVVNRPAGPFLPAFDFRLAYIDFEFSKYVPEGTPLIDVRLLPPTYHDLPEIKARWKHVDPFPADVYALGRTLEMHVKAQIEFERTHKDAERVMRGVPHRYLKLVEGMTGENASKRPSAMEALVEAQDIWASL